jgi:hypothetical protein
MGNAVMPFAIRYSPFAICLSKARLALAVPASSLWALVLARHMFGVPLLDSEMRVDFPFWNLGAIRDGVTQQCDMICCMVHVHNA